MHAHSGAVAPIVPVTETVEGWTLARFANVPDEPMIDADEAAVRIGADPKAFRQLVRKHAADGNINPFRIQHSECRIPGQRGRHAEGLYLNEADLHFMMTRSDAPNAITMTKTIIRVFMLARRGLLPSQSHTGVESRLLTLMESMLARLDRVEKTTDRIEVTAANDTGVVGLAWAERHILAPMRELSKIAVGASTSAKLDGAAKVYWSSRMNELVREFDHGRRGAAWKNFPKGKLVAVLVGRIAGMRAKAVEEGRHKPDPRQTPLFS